jgi:geranylgeranyl pyrophosphate synthase
VFRQELQRIVDRWTENGAGPPTIAQLPALACEAVGGDPSVAVPVTAAWQVVRLAAKLLDDVEDRDIDHRLAITLNAATSLIFAAPLVLNELKKNSAHDIAPPVTIALERATLRAAAGQHTHLAGVQMDSSSADPDTWLEIAQAKSGELFAWASWAGALAGGADEHTQEGLRQYGFNLGTLLQVGDDFNGIWGANGANDLARGCLSLPVCYARHVLKGAARGHLDALLSRVQEGDQTAEGEAANMLIQSGAQAYFLAVASVQYRQAKMALEQSRALTTHHSLITLMDGVMPMLASSGA